MLNHICHNLPDRTIIVNGEACWLCVRCSSLYTAFFVGIFMLLLFTRKLLFDRSWHFGFQYAIFLFFTIACIVLDVYAGDSNHLRRFLTGSLLGWSLAMLVVGFFHGDSFSGNSKSYLPFLLISIYFAIAGALWVCCPYVFVPILNYGSLCGIVLLAMTMVFIAVWEFRFLCQLFRLKGKK